MSFSPDCCSLIGYIMYSKPLQCCAFVDPHWEVGKCPGRTFGPKFHNVQLVEKLKSVSVGICLLSQILEATVEDDEIVKILQAIESISERIQGLEQNPGFYGLASRGIRHERARNQ